MTFIILLLTIILLITNNDIVLSGASYGLMLWYKNVLPILLPFMLISGTMEDAIIDNISSRKSKHGQNSIIATVFFLGLLCGYPIGAKTNAQFTSCNLINKRTGNIILPICNNVSPMFFLGFIITNSLKNSISPYLAYAIIYIPYIVFLFLELLIYPKPKQIHESNNIDLNDIRTKRNISEQSINQITMVGLYIMLCSIICEFILSIDLKNTYIKLLLVGITEITRGVTYISNTVIISGEIKTALIFSMASFGGISSVMQTAKVLQGSGLSLIHYITVKISCAICTFFLYLLIV